MLEIDNYEDRQENKYPCISIDWITDFERRYIQEQFSNYNNSLDELSALNNAGTTSDDLYLSEGESQSETNVESFEDFFSGTDAGFDLQREDDFDDFFSDNGSNPANLFSEEGLEDNSFDDIFGDEDTTNEEDVSLDELLSIVDEPLNNSSNKETKDRTLFGSKLPIYVDGEKIAEAPLNRESLRILNHFFKRKWCVEISEESSESVDETFIIKNVFNLV